jgi:hypothetical protein
MLQLNTRDKPIYSTPDPAPDNGPHANRWNPFEKEGDLKIMNTALEYLAKNATGIKSCDGYFRNLAKEAGHKPRSLTEMITGEDRSFISYDPTGPDYGRRSIIPLPWAESHCAGAIRWSLPRSYTNWHTLMERRASWKRKMLSFIAV